MELGSRMLRSDDLIEPIDRIESEGITHRSQPRNSDLSSTRFKQLVQSFRCMFLAREIDRTEDTLVKQGLAHFHVSGAGHEATALLAPFLTEEDWLHLHYRDKALLLARGMPPVEFFRSLLATAGSHSAGRQMSAHFSWRPANIVSMVGPVGNNALHAVGVAAAIKDHPGSPLAVCSVGDGTTQQGEFLEAAAEAIRSWLPVLFVVEDNQYAISTRTSSKTFYSTPYGPRDELFGLSLASFPGDDPAAAAAAFKQATAAIRATRGPQILIGRMERLANHTNADDQTHYRDADELARGRDRDPISRLRTILMQQGLAETELRAIEAESRDEVSAALASARGENSVRVLVPTKAPFPQRFETSPEYTGSDAAPRATMRQALNAVLRRALREDPRVVLMGEDIEDPKGDVFGLTKGLSTDFSGRVLNTALSESTIVGTAIGRSLAGQRPVAFIQFADFLPLAANQIISELSSMFWRTNGSWECPVVVMAPAGGYKPGLGPFHGQSFEAFASLAPGIDVVIPSHAGDAAGLLNAALQSTRPTLFLYPKAMLNLDRYATSLDVDRHFVHPGRARRLQAGADLTLVAYGNTVPLCEDVVSRLREDDFAVDLFDLRTISPWDRRTIADSARRSGRLVVAHEDNLTMGMGAEIIAALIEDVDSQLQVRRIGRTDTFIPYNFAEQLEVLPSFARILQACAEVLDLEAVWQQHEEQEEDRTIRAIGSGPADDRVRIVELFVAEGDQLKSGQLVAAVEATKATVEVYSTFAGTAVRVDCKVGDEVEVGTPLVWLDSPKGLGKSTRQANTSRSVMLRPRAGAAIRPQRGTNHSNLIGIGAIGIVGGSRIVTTEEIAHGLGRRSDSLTILTGISERRWIGDGQTLLGIATEAARTALAHEGIGIADIELVVACTGTPDIITPSLAARVYARLQSGKARAIACYDLNAACSGYLYALHNVFDFLSNRPNARALVITAEALSPLIDRQDLETAPMFGDAATATIVSGPGAMQAARVHLFRPVISGLPETGTMLSVPLPGAGSIRMKGRDVFNEGVPAMTNALADACRASGHTVDDLDWIVPSQSSKSTIEGLQKRVKRRVYNVIGRWGNTSSSSIPIALDALLDNETGDTIGLVAVGGGLTSAGAVGRIVRP